jgi:hypothetical protein
MPAARLLAAGLAMLAFVPSLPAQADTPELPDRIAAAWRYDDTLWARTFYGTTGDDLAEAASRGSCTGDP